MTECNRCGDNLPDQLHRTHTLWCSCGRYSITPYGLEIDEWEGRRWDGKNEEKQ